ncbi:CidA/LrgA family protein [Thalassospira marina]|nr:CidA/LrgA family protein [Thalassospira marina]
MTKRPKPFSTRTSNAALPSDMATGQTARDVADGFAMRAAPARAPAITGVSGGRIGHDAVTGTVIGVDAGTGIDTNHVLRPALPLSGLTVRGRYVLRNSQLLQIAAIFAFWLLGEAVVRFCDIPVPGGIIGMVVVFSLLASRRISLRSMRRGAQWYLAEMLLFFIPAVLAVLNHHELFGVLGAKVLVVILGSTASVIAVTALVMDLFVRFRGRHDLV